MRHRPLLSLLAILLGLATPGRGQGLFPFPFLDEGPALQAIIRQVHSAATGGEPGKI